MYTTRKDPYTGEEFVPKRNNQKFASRRNQVAHNNQKARERRSVESPITSVLQQNRRILANILGSKNEKSVTEEFLKGAGLNFSYWSQSAIYEGIPCQMIYEFALVKNANNLITIKNIKS